MTHSKKNKLLFASGIGCIALGYSLWMFIGMYKPDWVPMILTATLAAPVGAFAFAALVWHVVVEKLHFQSKIAGTIIGAVSGWSIFASGLLASFTTGIFTEGEGFRTIEGLVLQAKIAFGLGPLFLIMAWGWIPLLLCVLWGFFMVSLSNKD